MSNLRPLPDLRKQVMTKLIALKQTDPTASLADAQAVLAREHGFDSWPALQTAVTRRAKGWRNPNAPTSRGESLAPERFRLDAMMDGESDIRAHNTIFRNGILVQLGFLLAALAGLWLLFLDTDPGGPLHALQQLFAALLP